MGIRVKLLVPLFTLALLVLLGLKLLIWPDFLDAQLEQHATDEQKRAEILATALIHPLRNSDLAQVYSILENVRSSHPSWKHIQLLDAGGLQLYPLQPGRPATGDRLLEISHAFSFYTEPIGELRILIDLHPIHEQHREFTYRGDVLIVLVLFVAIIVAVTSQEKLITTPLKSLALAAQQISRGDFQARLPRPGRDEVGQLVRAFDDMRTNVQQHQKELHKAAHHDPLTGLPNRAMFLDRLEHAISLAHRTEERLALLFLDLDTFKAVNDTLGHPIGDQLLVAVARRLEGITREGDTVARLGGDEFMIVVESLHSGDEAGVITQKIQNAFQKPLPVGERNLSVTASIGITLYPDDAKTPSDLVQNADIAMYRAKAAGGGAFRFFLEETGSHELCGLELRSQLFDALEKQQYFLVYQPRIDLETGKVDCLEALIRWRCPTGQVVGPDRFIPLLEQTGLIVDVGEWVIRESCRFLRQQLQYGRDAPRVSVNLSARQFHDPGLLSKIQHALQHHDVSASHLELELTEGMIMADVESSVRALDALRTLGVALSIDDFGTGYSSLSYLKRFPVNYLKIDRSFIHGIPNDQDDVIITESIIALSHKLGIQTIAEGIENQEQLSFLEREGCTGAQGYLLSHPLPEAEITAWLRKHETTQQSPRTDASA